MTRLQWDRPATRPVGWYRAPVCCERCGRWECRCRGKGAQKRRRPRRGTVKGLRVERHGPGCRALFGGPCSCGGAR